MKRILTCLIVLLSIGLIATSCGNSKKTEQKEEKMKETTVQNTEFDIVTNMGTMRIRLYDKTPQHRDNFIKLVNDKFFDGIRFHRVIEGFMIQTGDPYSKDLNLINKWGTGGPEYTIFGEVIEGLEIIDAIATVPTDGYDRPLYDVIITTIEPIVKTPVQTDTTAVCDSVTGCDSLASADSATLAKPE
jgi:cyclophilin family peptidyl-prolyl cis-trans isomerase